MKIPFCISAVVVLLFSGCASSDYSRFYHRDVPLTKAPPSTPVQSITGNNFRIKNPNEFQGFVPLFFHSQNLMLGNYGFNSSQIQTPDRLNRMTADAGGDIYYYLYRFCGMRRGTRMVMTGYTTPQTISSSSQASAFGNFSGSYYGSGSSYGSLYGSGNAYGYGSSQTLVGGTESYSAMPYSYPLFEHMIVVLASPARQQELIKKGVLSPTQMKTTQSSLMSVKPGVRSKKLPPVFVPNNNQPGLFDDLIPKKKPTP